MNSIPSSKGTTVLVALVITVAAVGTAAAVTVSTTSAPEEAEVGEEVQATVAISNLYNEDDQWTLNGTTELQNPSWDVTKVRPAGNESVDLGDGDSTSFRVQIDRADNVSSVVVTVVGDAPEVQSFDYRTPQTFEATNLTKIATREDTLGTVDVHHYTNESRTAREAIMEAEDAVNGTDDANAESSLQNAIEWYNQGEFENAIENAEQAEQTANEAQESQNMIQLLLYGIGAVVVLLLIGGGILYYRGQQDSYDKLR